MNIKIVPKINAPFNIQFFNFLASSIFPAPSSWPKITPEAVTMPEKQIKNKFAITKPAAIPETTSAPPLVLYNALEIVSAKAQVNSEYKIIADFLKMEMNNLNFTCKKVLILNKNSGFLIAAYTINIANSAKRAITVA